MTRFMGTETEYGIMTPTDPHLSPIMSSTHAVVSYAAMHTMARARWDFQDEHPLKDARGFDLKRYHTVPVIDPNALGVANVVLPNGARYYVDHAHPEYSSPEVSNAWDAMVYDAAGDVIMNRTAAEIQRLYDEGVSVLGGQEPCPPVKFYKNNVDGKGASYGAHENYLYSRSTDFEQLAQGLIPFFVTRQIFAGAGRMGIGEKGDRNGFQISQRADYFFQEMSLETTLNRGIINTRDEPHADASAYGRLHVIVGDANLSQYATLLKMGTTSLVLDAIESGVDFSDLKLKEPVDELKAISHDLTLSHELRLIDGRRLSAIDIQREYLSRVAAASAVDKHVLELWEEILGDLERDPLATADRLDWTAKWALIKGFVDRGVDIADPKLKAIDLQYADINPAKSLHHKLVASGRMKQLVGADEIERAADTPPADSRAYLRGKIAELFGDSVVSSSWQTVVLATSDGHKRIDISAVDGFTRQEVEPVLAGGVDGIAEAFGDNR
ncbi:depupylase/deamidase Dop [Corynebacterium aquatimens]|uniref:Proteasome accessory factor A n=1 Tax=Corynebacterium aquatimens TaxID=1190508 RepID=A0A931E1E7_9CORY|nr:depupylase/deamidase Dop [Corynebacterium aquatimens]MBG6121586.1 proteasome accessory factor A [Corynebacterium aquatimens]WJY65874.1 Pup deamidase/depupylase [Corynebacterium aquatimens]